MLFDRQRIGFVEDIFTNRLDVEVVSAELTRHDGKETIKGKGLICQDSDGDLILKFFRDTLVDDGERLKIICDSINVNPAGCALQDSDFWSLEGFDSCKHKICASKLYSSFAGDNYVEFQLYAPLCIESNNIGTHLISFGHYRIPETDNYTTKIQGSDFLSSHCNNYFQVSLSAVIDVKVEAQSKFIDIEICKSDGELVSQQESKDVISALSFCFGVNLIPDVSFIGNAYWEIRPRPLAYRNCSSGNMPLTIGRSLGDDYNDYYKTLVSKYYAFIVRDQKKQLPVVEKRIYSSFKLNVFTMSSVLTTQIELLCKTYFSGHYKVDEHFDSVVSIALDLLNNPKIKNKDYNRLKSTLCDRKSKFTTRSCLASLLEEKILNDSAFPQVWNILRQKTSHGDVITGDEDELGLLCLYYKCINLYHQLVFHLIGYNGKYTVYELTKNQISDY